MKQYVHYGTTEFKPELFNPIENEIRFSKPIGGFWASPIVNSGRDWKDFCITEDFREISEDNKFEFGLSDNAKVLMISKKEDLMTLPLLKSYDSSSDWNACFLDFEQLLKNGVDAVEVRISKLYYALYGWDVDSILIMNPSIIVSL